MIVDIMNTNAKEHKMLCEQLDNDLVHKSLLTTIFGDLNEHFFKDNNSGVTSSAPKKSKKKRNFEREATVFVNSYKQALKDLHEINHFIRVQYQDDKISLNKTLNGFAKFSDFESRFTSLESRLFSSFNEKVGNYDSLFSETKSYVQTAIAQIEQEQARVSKETQWRVTDCERLLETRVNETYVKDYVKSVQQQLSEKVIHHP